MITESKSGRRAIRCKTVVDCTGDADVAWLAGVPYTKITAEESMGLTAVFNVSGVDKKRFLAHVAEKPATYSDWGDEWCANADKERDLRSPYMEIPRADGAGGTCAGGRQQHGKSESEHGADSFVGSWSSLSDAGEATNLNLVHLKNLDATNVKDLTTAEIAGRREALECIEALKQRVPGFEKSGLRNHAMTMGVRDSRKIVGKYNMTKDDVCEQGRWRDAVGVFPEFVDGYSVLLLPTAGLRRADQRIVLPYN